MMSSNAHKIAPAHAGTRSKDRQRTSQRRDHPRTRGDKYDIDALKKCASGSPPHTRGQEASKPKIWRICGITPAHAGTRILHGKRYHGIADHPRTRGDKANILSDVIVSGGSPPHTRGQGNFATNFAFPTGITPAHAGTRPPAAVRSTDSTDHPRTRGDKFQSDGVTLRREGSPPHTRGQVAPIVTSVINTRITSAHAGTRLLSVVVTNADRDHPRTRGDKFSTVLKPSISSGSPPHTRGQDQRTDNRHLNKGITPAHAGTSAGKTLSAVQYWDHPRTRGDKRNDWGCYNCNGGSPPHTRGQAASFHNMMIRQRITPAHAGTSRQPSQYQIQKPDHPRTRGDKQYKENEYVQEDDGRGSPPHTRGQGIVNRVQHLLRRITPAHAGTSRARCRCRAPTQDHPRTRGDKPASNPQTPWKCGSPPHTRGQVVSFFKGDFRCRITPAHAGTRFRFRIRCNDLKDHPRTHGDKTALGTPNFFQRGSPPHTRGQAGTLQPTAKPDRITPAHAGTSRAGCGNARGK